MNARDAEKSGTLKKERYPATILSPQEHFTCDICGTKLAGRQAHFDEQGGVFCVDDAEVRS